MKQFLSYFSITEHQINQHTSKFLQDDNYLEGLIKSSSLFVKMLSEDLNFTKDLFDIAIRPFYFEKKYGVPLSTGKTSKTIDCISNLYDDFNDLLIDDKVFQRKKSIEVSEQQIEEIIEMGSSQNSAQVDLPSKHILLVYIHKIFTEGEDKQLEDIALAYLQKLLSPLFFQRAQEIIKFYHSHPQIVNKIVEKFQHRGVMTIFCKVIESQEGKQFYSDTKIEFINLLYKRVMQEKDENRFSLYMENLISFEGLITEKLEQEDKNKYIIILNKLQKAYQQLLTRLLKQLPSFEKKVKMICLKWCLQVLRHDSSLKSSQNIQLTARDRRRSISYMFYNQNQVTERFQIQQSLMKLFFKVIVQFQAEVASSKGPHLIIFYKLLLVFVTICSQNDNYNYSEMLNCLMNECFFQNTYILILDNKFNNILHNVIKQLILKWIRSDPQKFTLFLNQENVYRRLFQSTFFNKELKDKTFEMQNFKVYQQIFKQINKIPSEKQQIIKEKFKTQQLEQIIDAKQNSLKHPIGEKVKQFNNLKSSQNSAKFSENSQFEEIEIEVESPVVVFNLKQSPLEGEKWSLLDDLKFHSATSKDEEAELKKDDDQKLLQN